jgi:hypothetical protein
MDDGTSEFYKSTAEAATRPTKNAATLGTATTKAPLELPWVLPVWLGAGEPVELDFEECDVETLLLLPLPERLEDGPEDREEGLEEGGTDEEVPLLRRLPVPQGILSPLGWVVWSGGVLFPFWSVMVNLVVQYFSVEEAVLNS